jgi:nucleotide-binding universal stress UspA family protein
MALAPTPSPKDDYRMTGASVLGTLSRPPCSAVTTTVPEARAAPALDRMPAMAPPPVIVVGYDASSESRAALTWALAEAAKLGAACRVVHVLAPLATTFETPSVGPGWLAAQLEDARKALGEEARHAQSETHTTTVPIAVDAPLGPPASTLVDAARSAALLVVGSRGGGRVAHALLGSVARYAIAHAPCPVVVIGPCAVAPNEEATS